jgi:RNA polymerase sigma factor (sigma-70 family)
MTTPDSELLKEFARDRSEKVFATLVSRHVDLVYSAALRQVRSPQLAEDVAQTVFIDLSHNADKLAPDTILTAWLYRVTRRAAIDVVRSEARRQLREKIAVDLATMNSPDTHWKEIEPLLDEAMDTLDETDRASILLRYFENKSLREVGERLGTSDDAAQKRVSRAVERLREFFSKRGVTIGASGLAVAISGNAVQAAPIGFALAISSALAGTTLASATTAAAIKTVAMTTLQKSLITAVVVAAVGAGIYKAREASHSRKESRLIQEQQKSLIAQNEEFQQERDEAKNLLEMARPEIEQLKNRTAEIYKLRGDVARLKAASIIEPTESFAKDWLARVNQLKERLKQTPEANIPELRFVNEYDWLNAARNELKTDNDFRRALSWLRTSGEDKFAQQAFMALQKYLKANNDTFPNQLSQLQPFFSPYFQPPVDNTVLRRWEIVPTTNGNAGFGGNWVITQKAAVDEDYDQRHWIGPNGHGGVGAGSFKLSQVMEVAAYTNLVKELYFDQRDAIAVASALKAFSAANSGQQVTNSSQLVPYLTSPEQQASLLRLSGEMGGVGVALSNQGDKRPPKIQRVISASAAEAAGIEPGSFLLSINGINTMGKSMTEWTRLIRGQVGTTVTLEVINPTLSTTNNVILTRAKL